MPIGVLVDCACVLAGALAGCSLGKFVKPELRKELTVLLGFCSMSIGINSLIKVYAMAPVVFSVLAGYVIGYALQLEERLTALMTAVLKKLPIPEKQGFVMAEYITVVVIMCFSGFGIYGTFVEAMSGDSSILFSKAVLDAVSALIFSVTLGYAVAIVPFLMVPILLVFFFTGKIIAPFVTSEMFQNFVACGGIVTVAAGLRISGIKGTKITNLVPALVLVMPLTGLWGMFK